LPHRTGCSTAARKQDPARAPALCRVEGRILQALAIERNRVGGPGRIGQLIGIFEKKFEPPSRGLSDRLLEEGDRLLVAVARSGRARLLDHRLHRLCEDRVRREERQQHSNTGDSKRPGNSGEKHLARNLESMKKEADNCEGYQLGLRERKRSQAVRALARALCGFAAAAAGRPPPPRACVHAWRS
jgi:hypothetical protein